MQIAFWLFLLLLSLSPVFLLAGGVLVIGALSACVAILVCIVGLSVRTGEGDHLLKVLRPVLPLPAAVITWMLFQTIPLPFSGMAHPVWSNVQSALGETVLGSLTIDTGATAIATAAFLVFTALTFVANATTIDRARAERLLVCLSTLTVVFAALLLVTGIGAVRSSFVFPQGATASLISLTSLGIVLNAANIIRIIERYETRKLSQNITGSHFAAKLTISCAGLMICCLATGVSATPAVSFVTATGFLFFIMVLLIRRVGFRPWESAGLLAVVAVAFSLVASMNSGSGDITLRFAQMEAPARAIYANMISNTPWAGNGAGAFSSILPIYQDAEGHLHGTLAPTTAVTLLIEFGRIIACIFVLMALFVFALLFSAALQRGRDSFYSTAASSCLIILLLESFCDASLLDTPVMIITAAILGLGMAQRVGRTDQSRLSVA